MQDAGRAGLESRQRAADRQESPAPPELLTVPWALCVGTTIRTPAGSEVTVTGAFPAWLAGRMVTNGVPAVA